MLVYICCRPKEETDSPSTPPPVPSSSPPTTPPPLHAPYYPPRCATPPSPSLPPPSPSQMRSPKMGRRALQPRLPQLELLGAAAAIPQRCEVALQTEESALAHWAPSHNMAPTSSAGKDILHFSFTYIGFKISENLFRCVIEKLKCL